MKKKLSLLMAFATGIAFTAIIGWNSHDDKKIAHQSNSISNPDSRSVLAVRKIKLKAGITTEAFEKFATKVANDEFGKIPGVKFYYGKGERGDDPGNYIFFMDFDSKSTRDFYGPC